MAIGKTDDDFIAEGISKYLKRLKHYIKFEIVIIPDLKKTKSLSQDKQKSKEAELFFKAINASDEVVILDEKGIELSSMHFADLLNKKMIGSVQNLVFLIGGPYGFDNSIYQRAHYKLSLSRMTFSHQMIRLFFVEQV